MNIKIQTMRDDLSRAQGKRPEKTEIKEVKLEVPKTPLPPKNLPISKKIPEKPRIIEKIIEKPVIKEVPVIKEIIKEKIVKVIDREKIAQIRQEYEKKIKELENRPPKIKVVEKIVEKPVIKEVVKEKVIVKKEKPAKKENKRTGKQIKIILILILVGLIGFGGYYLLSLQGEEIIIDIPEPPPIELEPIIDALIPIDGVHISLIDNISVNFPIYFDQYQRNFLKFADDKRGLVMKVDNNLSTLAEITLWEKNMATDLVNLFLGKIPKALFRVNNWEFPNLVIRYQNTSDLENSLHYALVKDKLIITTSATNMRLILNNLWINP